MSEDFNKKEKEINSLLNEKYRSDTDFTNNLNRDESMIQLDSQMSYPTNSINNITSYYRNSDTNKQQDQLDISSQMNELIENNSLNIIALQKVLNCLVIHLGKSLLEAKDFKRSFRKSEKKSSHTKDDLDNDNDQDNLSRQSDDNDSIELDRLEEDEVKPLKIVKNQRLNKNLSEKSKSRLIEDENDDKDYVDPSFGITVNSKGFANVKEEKLGHKRSSELNNMRSSSKYDITQNSKSRDQKDSLESSMKRDIKKENKSNNEKRKYDPEFQEKIKSEIMIEIKKQVDQVSATDHSSIQIQQVQKIPDNTSNETLKEELTELQQLFSKIVDKDKDIEKILNDIQGRTNKAAMDINNIKTDFHKCASKDEISNITSIIPNLSTKEDVEMVVEKLKDKLDLNEQNTVKIQINKLEQNQTMQVLNHSQEERLAGIEDSINNVKNAKVDAKFVLEKTQDVRQEFVDKFTDYHDFKESQKERLDNIQKNFTKLEKSIENKAHKDQIWELKEKFQEFATKQTLIDLEDKVFPIMTEVVDRIRSFQKHIDESSRQMVRFDEVIVDKASKHDLAKINKKLENTLEIDRFEELKKEFDTQSKSSSSKIESQDSSIENIKLQIDEIKVKAEETTNSVTALTEINMDQLKKDDLNLVWERLDTKSDKLDLLKIYDVKSNKSDISMLLKCIDSVQMNVKQLSNISVSTMRVINYSLMNEDLVKTDKNRQIVLQNLQNFYKQMIDQRIGDVATGNYKENKNHNENHEDKINQGVIDEQDDNNERDKNYSNFNFNNTNSSDKRIDGKILRQSLNMTPLRGIGSKYKDESRENRNQKNSRNMSNSKSFVLPNIHK